MNLINELGNDIAIAYLLEGKYREKLKGDDVAHLISRVRVVLELTGVKREVAVTARAAAAVNHRLSN